MNNPTSMKVDHVVIGAGIVGCATAYFLAQAGRSIVIIDAEVPGSGASGGPGMRGVRSNNRDTRELDLARESQRWWPRLDAELGESTGFERRGGLELFEADAIARDGGIERLKAKQAVQRNFGIDTEILERRELITLIPDLADSVTHALWSADDGVVPQAQATHAFFAAATALGVVPVMGETVATIEELNNRAVSVGTKEGSAFTAEKSAVIAAGYRSKMLISSAFGIELPLWATAFHASFVEPRVPYSLPYLIGHDSRHLAAKQVGTAIQVSGFLTAPWDFDKHRTLAADSLFERSLETFRTVFRGLGEFEMVATEGRVDSSTPDRLQIIDRIPGSRSTYIAAGWSGHGFATAPAVGRALSEWLLSGTRPNVLAALGLDRFGMR